MSLLDNEYDLDEVDRQFLAKEVSALANTEEAFASYKEKFASVWKHKNKESIKAQAAEIEKKISDRVEARLKEVSKASASPEVKVEEQKADVTAALDNATATNKAPDSKIAVEQSFREKFAKAFSRENISVSYSK